MRIEVVDSGLRDSGLVSWFAKESSSTGKQHVVFLYADDVRDGTSKALGRLSYTLDASNPGVAMVDEHSLTNGLQGTAAETELYRAVLQADPSIKAFSAPMSQMDRKLAVYDPAYTDFARSMQELGMETRQSGGRLVSEPAQAEHLPEVEPER